MTEEEIRIFLDPVQYTKDLEFDANNINVSMQQQASLHMHYAGIAVRCRTQVDRLKQNLEIVESILDGRYRSSLREENPKVTEAQIKAAVLTDRQRRVASQQLIDANTQYRLAEAVERSFEQRKEMMQSISRNQVHEMGGTLRQMANQDGRTRMMEAMAGNREKHDA